MTTSIELANSTYLDFAAHGLLQAGTTTVQEAYGYSDSQVAKAGDDIYVNVALIFNRANDPTALLESDWATRQKTLGSMTSAELWATYGADKTSYDEVGRWLEHSGYTVLGNDPSTTGAYVTSAESRTIWVSLNGTQFKEIFGTELMKAGVDGNDYDFLYWNDNLSLSSDLAPLIGGVWVDNGGAPPAAQNLAGSVSATLTDKAQSPGNSTTADDIFNPQDIASEIYNFPLDGQSVQTGLIGLVEPGIGSSVPGSTSFQDLLVDYRTAVGTSGTGVAYTQGEAGATSGAINDERSLDVGIVTAINPNSDLALYVGSGYSGWAFAGTFTAYQSAFWQTPAGLPAGTLPQVISSSWFDTKIQSPDSPFYWAYQQLYIDAALQNMTVLICQADGGSGNETANGVTNVQTTSTSPYNLMVGGTSVSTEHTAHHDTTLADLLSSARAGDMATLWQLAAGGLKAPVSDLTGLSTFVETVWNEYYVDADKTFTEGYMDNNASGGGVDTTQPQPGYQTDYGLAFTDVVSGLPGRATPDVTANAGGNMFYWTPEGDMTGLTGEGGTSAATPLWAALISQFNAIFADQGLPQLGYMNDLLYQASAVAPGAFNDITIGNNNSTFYLGGAYSSDGKALTPTDYGYEAQAGFDLVSGLGSPNGLLLARALTAIAHTQMSFDPTPVLETSGSAWVSTVSQSLLFQSTSPANEEISLNFSKIPTTLSTTASAAYAWTSQFAQQVLQEDFSAELVTLFDQQAQGTLYQAHVHAGDDVGISIGGTAASAYQAALTADYGFIDFANANGSVDVARPVAVAFTAGGADDMEAVVRLRQNGENVSSLTFYKVDDFAGTIGGLHPGETGYATAAATRAYQTSTGTTSLTGAGYGQYSQASILGVDAGDIIAMSLTSAGHTYWAFSSANEQVDGEGVAHLWSYGLNTWGWEDIYGGGDHDFNDLVVQLDFTSATGQEWLV
ncbi:DUF4114 domain-containing protein [Aquabacter sp. P-9]|uniref:DUF4114 domain-containing protein n=1 Tax=Aquabacter sediminis TaxID=3029197 RepID=UPI00237D7CAA|nr:DUF4114 domain-containing protein [Aquabacter sp. P-9]MDE1567694.1 hypothetical protein [Aquabacter sp. P-9]